MAGFSVEQLLILMTLDIDVAEFVAVPLLSREKSCGDIPGGSFPVQGPEHLAT
jgi:hypothetical protein